jgi:hypothetical protein
MTLAYFFHSPNLAGCKSNFDTMRMYSGFRQYIFHDSVREFAGALVLLEYNGNSQSGCYILSFSS